jgi:hypothetical protein
MRLRQRKIQYRGARLCRRSFSFERLENRELMAVTTSLSRGTLSITGDDASDDIAIVGTATPGELVVKGRNGTLVDGIANGATTVSGVTFNLEVALNDGHDVLSMDDVYIAGSISIGTHDGDDVVTLGENGEVSPARALTINTGEGNDRVAELNYAVYVGGEHAVVLRGGDDIATLVGTSAVGTVYLFSFATGIDVFGDAGNDSILATGLTAVQRIQINGGEGVNSTALLFSAAREIDVWNQYEPNTAGTSGRSTVYLDTNYCQNRFSVQAGNAAVNVFRTQATSLSVFLSGGSNIVNLYGNALNGPAYYAPRGEQSPLLVGPSIRISDGASGSASGTATVVSLSYNVTNDLSIALSGGNDSLFLAGNLFTGTSTLDGGLGSNTIAESYNVWGSLIVANFY